MANSHLYLKTLPLDIIQNIVFDKDFDFDTNTEFDLVFYIMSRLNCKLRFKTFSNNPNKCILDDFKCEPRNPGEGRRLLLDVLNTFKNEKPLIQTIELIVLPKKRLIDYYKQIGFEQVDSNYMEGNIDDIINNITNKFGGRKSKRRIFRKGKSKRKRRSKRKE